MAELTGTRSLTATRMLGAAALLVIGGVHYQQYHYAFYSSIPTIGPLFLLNFIAATALGLFLLAPVRSRLGRRVSSLDQLAAVAGVGVAAGGLVALLVSEQTPLFGFMEHGYRFAIVLAIVSDAVAIVMLMLFLIRTRSATRNSTASPSHERPRMPSAGESINERPVSPAAWTRQP